MTKFQKAQKISSIIPVFSSVFILATTMIVLEKAQMKFKQRIIEWIKIILLFAGFFMLSTLATSFIPEENSVLATIVVGCILAPANCLCVDIQAKWKNGATAEEKNTAPKKHTVGWIVGGVIVAIVLACIIGFVTRVLPIFPTNIADSNGEQDTGIASIPMENILDPEYVAYNIVMFSSFHRGEQTNAGEDYEEEDWDICTVVAKKMSGIMVLQATQTESDEMTLILSSEVETGNFAFYIFVEDELYKSVAANQEETIHLEGISGKLVLVKIAGESAKIQVSAQRLIEG